MRALLCAVAVVLVVGACSGDDDDTATVRSTTTTVANGAATGVCALVDLKDISAVIGVVFDKAAPSENACVFGSTGSPEEAISLHVAPLGENPPDLALETMGSSCDEGTVKPQQFAGADGGFSCLAAGAPTVVAAGGGDVLVLIGSSRKDPADQAKAAEQLVAILQRAIASES